MYLTLSAATLKYLNILLHCLNLKFGKFRQSYRIFRYFNLAAESERYPFRIFNDFKVAISNYTSFSNYIKFMDIYCY